MIITFKEINPLHVAISNKIMFNQKIFLIFGKSFILHRVKAKL